MESGFDPLKVKVRENPAWVALGGEVPSLTIPFQLCLVLGSKKPLTFPKKDLRILSLMDTGQVGRCIS
jgi:hypothetical protein